MKNIALRFAKQQFFPVIIATFLSTAYTVAPAIAADTQPLTKKASGLQYRDLSVGTGAVATPGQLVRVHYTGWLQNPDGNQGKKFDSSKDRGDPFTFELGGGQVIRGWDEGVSGMRVGGTRKLIIPATLGYGSQGAGGSIPPNAILLFDVELLGVK